MWENWAWYVYKEPIIRIDKLIKNAVPFHPVCMTEISQDIFPFLQFCYLLQKLYLASWVTTESVAYSVLLRNIFHHLYPQQCDLPCVMDELIASSPESLSHFISTSISRGVLQLRMLHSPPVTLHKFPLPSALLNLTHGAASHTHIILFPWGSAILWKLWTDSAVERYNSTIYCNVFDKRDVTYYQVRQSHTETGFLFILLTKSFSYACISSDHFSMLSSSDHWNPQSSFQDHDFQTSQDLTKGVMKQSSLLQLHLTFLHMVLFCNCPENIYALYSIYIWRNAGFTILLPISISLLK